jgi:hypothetical protein
MVCKRELKAFVNCEDANHRVALALLRIRVDEHEPRQMCKQCTQELSLRDGNTVVRYLKRHNPILQFPIDRVVEDGRSTEIARRELLLAQALDDHSSRKDASKIAQELVSVYSWSFHLNLPSRQLLQHHAQVFLTHLASMR